VRDEEIERLLDGARWWGLELDPRYRVLAATFEPEPAALVTRGPGGDPRVQLLCHPVATLLASLRDGAQILTFTDTQLVDVSARFGGAVPEPPLFGRPEPRPGAWAPIWSLEGRSSAPDGKTRTLTIRVREGDRALDVFARFDMLALHTALGTPLTASARGDRHAAEAGGPHPSGAAEYPEERHEDDRR
jgi:hypothetical protein